jgi:ElaB/YqjD/DUF883 family membrane-anchored ribosome-binding protein
MPNNMTKPSTATDVKNKAEDVVKEAGRQFNQAKDKAEDMAKDVGHQIGQKADDATAAAGRGMQTVADTIREHAPSSGVVGSAAKTVSETIQSGGRYLESEKFSGMMDDLTDVVRKNPVPTLFIALAVGFLLARAMSSRS